MHSPHAGAVIRNRRASYQDNVLPSMIEQVPKLTRGGTIAPNSKSKSKTSRLLSVLPGTSPGTLVVGDSHKFPSIKITAYNLDVLEELIVGRVADIQSYLDRNIVTWIDVRGDCGETVLREFADMFHIHPLALEDIANVPQRPKSELYEFNHFVIARMVWLKASDDMEAAQISIFLGPNYVLTFMEDMPDCLDPVRERIRRKNCMHRKLGADYLFYSILDAIVDHYFPVLESYGEHLELLEDETVFKPGPTTLSRVHVAKRELLDLRRVVWPQRDCLNSIVRDDSPFISKEINVYLRDCYDHTVQIMDMVETYREVASGLHDVYLSSVGQRTNDIMKVLTIISTIFIPLTFIAGVYGMNFDPDSSAWNMPELRYAYGYPLTILAMFLIGLVLLIFFWRKGWIFASSVQAENDKLS